MCKYIQAVEYILYILFYMAILEIHMYKFMKEIVPSSLGLESATMTLNFLPAL